MSASAPENRSAPLVDQSQGTVAVLVWFAFLDSDFPVLLLLCSECSENLYSEQEGAKRIKPPAKK